MLPLLQYPLQRANARREHPSYLDLPTYTRMRRRQEDCRMPGRRYLIIQGRNLYIHILRKRNMIIPDVFAVLSL